VRRRSIHIITILIALLAGASASSQQFRISGTVYDSSRSYPLEAVSVLSTAGRGTITDANGNYQIEVSDKDSIWFSYLGKPTQKFPVIKILTQINFDIALQVNVPVLKEVKVSPRNYRLDSIQNRQDYAKIFNYRKPGLRVTTPTSGTGVAAGFDLNQIIDIFRFKKKRSMVGFQQRLLAEEREKFISHRFNKGLVRRLTNLDGNALDSFMLVFRPSYDFTAATGDYDFQLYIKTAYERFKQGLGPPNWLRLRDEDDDM
jgi:hypothetical protein